MYVLEYTYLDQDISIYLDVHISRIQLRVSLIKVGRLEPLQDLIAEHNGHNPNSLNSGFK